MGLGYHGSSLRVGGIPAVLGVEVGRWSKVIELIVTSSSAMPKVEDGTPRTPATNASLTTSMDTSVASKITNNRWYLLATDPEGW